MSSYLRDVTWNSTYLGSESKAKICKAVVKPIITSKQKLAQTQLEQKVTRELGICTETP